jgi:hypothetical protein
MSSYAYGGEVDGVSTLYKLCGAYGRPIQAGRHALNVLIQTFLLIRKECQQPKCEA